MAHPKGLQYYGRVGHDSLSQVGAGVQGWIENPAVVWAISGDQLAVAKDGILLIQLTWRRDRTGQQPVLVQVGDSPENPQNVTSLEWLIFDEFRVLAVGTSQGALLLYSEYGTLLFRQHFLSGPVHRIRARQDSNVIVGTTASEDVSIVFQKSILRIDVQDLYMLLRRFVPRGSRSGRRLDDLQRSESMSLTDSILSYETWNVSKLTTSSTRITDGTLACVMAPPLLEHQLVRHYCVLTVGADYTLAAFRVSGERRRSLAGAVFNRVMPAAVSTISSLTKRFWRADPASESNRPTEVSPQASGSATLITTIRDDQRRGVSLAVSPSGSLAAVTDTLGRISLVDVQALVIVRLWKGYREAHCMFLEVPRDGVQGYEDVQSRRKSRLDRDNFTLCLAIHAPRRGVVEVWQMRYGARLTIIRCTESCRLIQPSCKFKFSNEPPSLETMDLDEYYPAKTLGGRHCASLNLNFLRWATSNFCDWIRASPYGGRFASNGSDKRFISSLLLSNGSDGILSISSYQQQ